MQEGSTNGELLNLSAVVPAGCTECSPKNQSDLYLRQSPMGVSEGEFNHSTRNHITDRSILEFPFATMMLILELLNLIFAPLGLTGNTVVLWFLGFCMRRNVVSVYILNLAGADFLFLCCHITGSVNDFLHGFNFTAISIYKVLFPVMMCSYITGLSMLSAISAERCLSVLWPVWHRHHRPRHMSAVICALLWLLSLLLSILVHIYCYLPLRFYCFPCPTVSFITAAWMIFLFMALCGSSLALLLRMLCGSRRLPLTRLYVTLGVAVLVFLLCGLPIGILMSLLSWFTNTEDFIYYNIIALFLSAINSSVNPFIYFFVGSFKRNQHQRQQLKSLKLILKKALEERFPPPALDTRKWSGGAW